MWLLHMKLIEPQPTVPQDVAAHLICSHEHRNQLRSLVRNSGSLGNNNHIFDLYKNKFIIITLYTKMFFLSHTDNAKWDHWQHYSTHRYKQEVSFMSFVKTAAHSQLWVWCRHPGCWEPSSLHECSVWTLWGPGSWSVSSGGPSQCEAWLGCQFWPARF